MENENYGWIYSHLQKFQIKNKTFEEINQLFSPFDNILLHNYFLVEIGYDDEGEKQLVFFKIVAQGKGYPLLRGPHQILGCAQGNWCLFWVSSLTRLKYYFMGMRDRLPFERSTYLMHSPSQSLLRLRCMRHRLHVPITSLPPTNQIWNHPCPTPTLLHLPSASATSSSSTSSSSLLSTRRHTREVLTHRTQRQLKRAVQQMYLSYSRDLPELPPEELKQELSRDIFRILYSF